jgi:uncharacterized protein (TIGR02145 family)
MKMRTSFTSLLMIGFLFVFASNCKKEKEPVIEYGTVTDIDGNMYKTVKIGTQEWLAENLRTTKYNDGTVIPNVKDNTLWTGNSTGAYCDYNNIPSNSDIYGRLYNWYVVVTTNPKNVCPTDWHVPLDTEWTTLETYLGGKRAIESPNCFIGGKLKETGTLHWQSPNEGATNEIGFTALPGGVRELNGLFLSIGLQGVFWTATESNNYGNEWAWDRNMLNYNNWCFRTDLSKNYGLSVRCIKD